jgi:hypothetical protein
MTKATTLASGFDQQSFDSIALAQSAVIPAAVKGVLLLGYSAREDAPPVNYLRAATQPSHAGKFQSADGAWWELNAAQVSPQHFGAVGSGAVNDRNAVENWLKYLQAEDSTGILPPRSQYRIDSALSAIEKAVKIEGAGSTSSGFVRNFNGTSGVGIFHLTPSADASSNPNGTKLAGFYANMAAGTTGGCHISGVSTSAVALAEIVLEDLYLTTFGSNTNENVLNFNGTAKTTGAIGVRVLTLRNVKCFGATGYSCVFSGVESLHWTGGGVYAAGSTGTASGGIQITGTATVKSANHAMHIDTCSGLNLTQLSGGQLHISSIGAISSFSIANDITCSNVCVYTGFLGGTVTSNWVSSGVRRTGAAFATT